MSNFRAIATVTATLQRTLQDSIQHDVSGATVTFVRPAEGDSTELPDTGVNIFLYRVSPNPHGRNADLPTRRDDGNLVQRPVAALDLQYLFSFYGSDATLEPQRLLASTVAYLHSQPLLTRAQIEATISDTTRPFLAGSDLAEEIDLVRFAPVTLSLDDLSRLWSVLLQVRYVLSVVYQASVLLVERQLTPRPALPTRAFNLAAVPLRQPYVARLVAKAGEGAPITAGGAVVVHGIDLRAEATTVEIDAAEAATDTVAPDQIALTLPAGLAAGTHTIAVRQAARIGADGPARTVFASNLGSFVLQPTITKTGPDYDIEVTDVQGTGSQPRSATVTVKLDPPAGRRQTATLELLTAAGVAHTFLAGPRPQDTATLAFPVQGVGAGTYLVRVRLDGAESPMELDAQRVPVKPEITIP
jgi:hypothetical protein